MMENKTEVVLQKPGFWRIAAAYLIDIGIEITFLPFLIGIPMLAFGKMFLSLLPMIETYGNILGGILFVVLCGSPVLSLYYVVLETWLGASAGKLSVGIYVKPHSFWRILCAYWLDMILVIGSVFLISSMYSRVVPKDGLGSGLLGFCAGLLMYIVDFIFIEGLSGASLGKACMGIKVYQK